MTDIFDVTGKVCLVTGGLGQIGVAFVRELHSRGASVAVASRSTSPEAMKEVYGGLVDSPRLMGVKMDITSKESIEAALDEIEERFGRCPDSVINNAGLDTQPSAPPEVSGPFEDFPIDVFREVVDVNLVGTFLVTQATGKRMRQAGISGSIVNVGSIYGMVSPVQDIYAYKAERGDTPFIKPVAYSAAKSGIYNLTRYCATYWAKNGIRVNTLTPSGVGRDTQDEEFQKNYTSRIPIGRMANVEDFVGPVVFLISKASEYMTGSNLVVDGGWTAW